MSPIEVVIAYFDKPFISSAVISGVDWHGFSRNICHFYCVTLRIKWRGLANCLAETKCANARRSGICQIISKKVCQIKSKVTVRTTENSIFSSSPISQSSQF